VRPGGRGAHRTWVFRRAPNLDAAKAAARRRSTPHLGAPFGGHQGSQPALGTGEPALGLPPVYPPV